MGEEYIEQLKEKVTEYNDDTWLAELLILEEYEECRSEIKNDLRDYPVLRSRISQISDTFKTKKSTLNEIERYTERVKWHLRRMYRTRNAIIHSGEEATNIKLLGEHLHSYLDCCLYEIITKLANRRNMDAALVDIVLSTELMLKFLKNNDNMDIKVIKILIKG